ncbi:MAG: hypothetical protein AB7O44_27525 [Hyphomicrobiaceae bacterium]
MLGEFMRATGGPVPWFLACLGAALVLSSLGVSYPAMLIGLTVFAIVDWWVIRATPPTEPGA